MPNVGEITGVRMLICQPTQCGICGIILETRWTISRVGLINGLDEWHVLDLYLGRVEAIYEVANSPQRV
jgi:hypothetical protein